MPKVRLSIILLICLLLGLGLGLATPTRHPGTSTQVTVAPADDAWRAALPGDPEAATQAYLNRIAPEALVRADRYAGGSAWLGVLGLGVTLASMAFILNGGHSAAMRDRAERFTRRRALQTIAYVAQFYGATILLSFPLTVFAGFLREHRYGLATQSLGAFLAEQTLAVTLNTFLYGLLFALLYGVIRRLVRTWWIWGTAASAAFLVIVILLSPTFIEPIFNRFRPLEEGPAKAAVLALTRAQGMGDIEVLQFDQSQQHNRISGHVSGILSASSIRLNDNLLKRCTPLQVQGVMAHELGHFVLRHNLRTLAFYLLVLAGGFAFLRWGFAKAQARWGSAWGLRGVGDTAGLPLLVALFVLYIAAVSPLVNAVSRVTERQADAFALEAHRAPDAYADVILTMADYRAMDPGPVSEFLFCDHPSPRKRILEAMRWKAQHPGRG